MALFNKFFTSKEQKQSASAPVIVSYTVGQPQWMSRDYAKFSEEAYKRNVIAHRCIKMIAEGCASITFTLQADGKDVKSDHPLMKLLNRPNPMMARSEFIEAVMSYRLIAGNSYIEAVTSPAENGVVMPDKKPPLELFTYRPDRMQIIPAANGYPAAYRYTDGSKKIDFVVDGMGNSQVLHLRSFNPLNYWMGLSPVEAAAYSIDQHNQAGAWNKALLENGARPSGALIMKGGTDGAGANLTDEQRKRLKAQLEERYSSAVNAGRPLVLEGGMDWKEMGISPKDMDFLEMVNTSARNVSLAFGVPPMLLGIPGDNTYSNMQEAKLTLWEDTIIPLFRGLVTELNHWLAPRFGKGLEIGYDEDSILALIPRRKEKWQMAQQADFLTVNQKLEMTGYGNTPQDGGDTVLVDANKVPLAQAGMAQMRESTKPSSGKAVFLSMLKKCDMPHEEAAQLADRMYGSES